ncbi:S-layer homology domain-containing protein [Paenibacillus sp. UNCCL117]|uniref:S-layer homology domain-containing protein n=1 Tax=unclassified Paenibacillus TaxID=185978 RepID=UPI0008927373|nr:MULTISPECIES: S-layer homology domain-containing protein [unclassified Paenibacillus]SDD92258.1 S-layer homology domain-containing protein [Paenibacillus sp. cl123]SFW43525.1 S-layer homology domain-containing protein [Paenibacillus sp. UNCCL117]
MNKTPPKWLRRIALAMTVTVGLSGLASQPLQAASRYSDVTSSYVWATSSIDLMTGKQIITGYPDGLFHPDQAISKAEWSAMVYRLFDTYRPNAKATELNKIAYFADVPADHWAYKPITDLYDATFRIGGFGVNEEGQLAFNPDRPLTRLQLAQMLYAMFGGKLADADRLSDNDACAVMLQFKDMPTSLLEDESAYWFAKSDGRYDASGWMRASDETVYKTLLIGKGPNDCRLGDDPLSNVQAKGLAGLKASGIMSPTDNGRFRPKDPVTRAEAVVILDRMYHYLKNKSWLSFYSTVELDPKTGTGQSSGSGKTGGSPAPGGTPSTPLPPASGGNPYPYGGQPGSSEWTDKSVVHARDYFDENGVLTKNVATGGDIEAVVQPQGSRYLTVDFEAKEGIDMYVVVDGKISFVKKEEFPLTLSVSGVSLVGFRSQLRDTNLKSHGNYNATLSVKLTNQAPETKKKR